MEERITLKKIEALLSNQTVTISTLATKSDMEESVDALARITAKGFEEVGARIESLDVKLDYRFTSLSNRIDDLALNKISRDEHRVLAARVSDIEERLI